MKLIQGKVGLPREAFPKEFLSASASHFLISRQDLFFPYVR